MDDLTAAAFRTFLPDNANSVPSDRPQLSYLLPYMYILYLAFKKRNYLSGG